ncbi:alpha/beta hydrolase [Capnocytophaga canimorsus]|uniref:alpha/beta hydrolase n=1 Tax=Capnocytophaga canimorsus TaxID=28188 RepID=UPI0037D113FD
MKIIKALLFVLSVLCLTVINAQEVKKSQEIQLTNGDFAIDGVLQLPDKIKSPLLIYVPGSGNIDRNGNQPNTFVQASYIQQLADSLVAKGIAIFRYDKRTANTKNKALLSQSICFEDFVSDVKTIISYFRNDERFSSVNLLGHSQGALVAMLAIDSDISRLICVAGPSENVEQTLVAQLRKQSPALADKAKEHFQELMDTGNIAQVHPFLISIFAPVNLKFLQSYNKYTPIQEIRKLQLPVLIVNGTSDLQVSPADAKKMHTVASDSRLVIIENMTHVLKIANNLYENQQTYINPKYPISTELVKQITDFLTQN